MIRQPINRDTCPPAQKNREGILRAAWLAVPDPLHSRPDPRRPWDAAARSECPYNPWDRTIEPLRSALRAAIRTGNPDKVKAVALRIDHFFDAMHADVLSVLPLRDEANMIQLAIEEAEAQGPADVAVVELVADPSPCPAKLEKAEQTLARHASANEKLRTRIGSLLRNGFRPQLTVAR